MIPPLPALTLFSAVTDKTSRHALFVKVQTIKKVHVLKFLSVNQKS
jgi:hypothetical protein